MNLVTSPAPCGGLLVVALSRRNLEGLLRQMDDSDNPEMAQIARTIEGTRLIVLGEEDDQHYEERE